MTNNEKYKKAFDLIISDDLVMIDMDEIKNHKRKAGRLSIAAIIIIIFSIGGGTVYAAQKYFGIFDYMQEQGITSNANDNYNEHIIYNAADDILSIDEAYIDGTILCFRAHLIDNKFAGKIDLGDHVKIDGEDRLLYSFDYVGDGEYLGIVKLAINTLQGHRNDSIPEIKPGENIDIELCIIDADGNIIENDYSISLNNDYIPAQIIPEQTIELSDGITASVKKSYISSSQIILNIDFEGETEQNEKMYDFYTNTNIYDDWTEYYIEDDKGNRKSLDYTGSMGKNWSIEINGFNTTSKYIMFIPYTVPVDTENDKPVYENAKEIKNCSFTINLVE